MSAAGLLGPNLVYLSAPICNGQNRLYLFMGDALWTYEGEIKMAPGIRFNFTTGLEK